MAESGGQMQLLVAAALDDVDQIAQLLPEDGTSASAADISVGGVDPRSGATALHIASRRGNAAATKSINF